MQPLTDADPGEIAGYRIGGRLGTGGMGRVYLAFTEGGRPVALKVIRPELGEDPEFRHRFRQEIAAARRVHGLYTAQVLDANPDATPPWLVTAYVPGPSLQETVTSHGPMPPGTVLLMMAGVAEALRAIHTAGVVHRDLKPSNVLLAPDGPRVIDFGIAWAAEATAVTRTGIRVGSPQFMAPEQISGVAVAPAIDVFALGSLAAFAATGRPPFGQGSMDAVLYRVLHEPADLQGCPPPLRGLIERCLAKQPADRPAVASIVAEARQLAAGPGLQVSQSWLPAGVAAALARHTPPAPPPTMPRPTATGQPPPAPPRPVPPPQIPPPPYNSHPGRTTPFAPAPERPARPPGPRTGTIIAIVAVVLALAVVAAVLLDNDLHGKHNGAAGPALSPSLPAPSRHGSTAGHQSPPARTSSSTAPVAPAGRWYAGVWAGNADQPSGVVTSWSVDLSFTSGGKAGVFVLPTLDCSGVLLVTGSGPGTLSVREVVLKNPRQECAPDADMTLTRSGVLGMHLAWQDAANPENTATGTLIRIRR